MKIICKVLEGIIISALIVLLFINGCYAYSKYIKKDAVANVFGYTYLTVLSNSMTPEFEYGDKLIIKVNDEYKVGDVVTYKIDDVWVTHRIVEIYQEAILTKGDNNNTPDKPVNKENIIGVVKKIIK